MRNCTKPACPHEATARCGFNYADRSVWLTGLGDEPDPSTYDLCEDHAHALKVPQGWTLKDLREQVDADVVQLARSDRLPRRSPPSRRRVRVVQPEAPDAASVEAEDDDGDEEAQASLL